MRSVCATWTFERPSLRGALRPTVGLAALVALLLVAAPARSATSDATDRSEVTTQRLIVKFRGDASAPRRALAPPGRVAALAEEGGVALSSLRAMALGAHVVELGSAVPLHEARAIARRLAASADVEYVEPDRRLHASVVPNDPRFNQQTYLGNGANAIAAVGAWDITTGSSSTVVAVVDSGYRPHVDLSGRILPGYDFISDRATANDGDGRDPDATDPGDWVTQADVNGPFQGCTVRNSSWHGTGTAGNIAANSNNGSFVAGINWAARVSPLRALGKCGGYVSDIADAIAWAGGVSVPGVPANGNPAQIINLSLGGDGPCSSTSQAAINAALANGITRAVVVAAGNDAVDAANHEPANCAGVISVAATNSAGNRASYSNFGPSVTISAPGGDPDIIANDAIAVLTNSGTTVPAADSWKLVSGTSEATSMVSGVVSLLLAVAPNLSAAQIRSVITSSAQAFPRRSTCSIAICGAGIVNAQAAVRAAQALGGGAANYQGLWWAAGGVEPGWGINFAHQGDTIFATWFTYDANRNPWWLSMTANKTGNGVYNGTLYQTSGPALNAVPFDPAQVSHTPVGTGRLTFTGPRNGKFDYTITDAISQQKAIELQTFGPVPTCVWGARADLTTATNYQDLWWAADGLEPGWGVNLTHQGTTMFATWFTYDANRNPLWYSAAAAQTGPGTYTGALIRSSGPPFSAVPFDGSTVQRATVGTVTLSFSNGNSGTLAYQVNEGPAASQVKSITRQVFNAPGTVCN